MAVLNPYLNFPGTAEEAFTFYKSVFGGEFAMIMRFKDTQSADQCKPEDLNKIMHVALPIGKGNVLMGSDAPDAPGMPPLNVGNNFSLALGVDSDEEADKLYAALSAGGNAIMPMAKMFWGDYWGMLQDKFGIHWMVSHSQPQQH